MSKEIDDYYDRFAERFVQDYIRGNWRIDHQKRFFASALSCETRTLLVVGCGSGETALFLARHVVPQAQVLGVDLSQKAVDFGNTMFRHPRVQLRRANVITDPPLGGSWDAIVLPDVYEHIEISARPILHERLSALLAADGKILITVPTPAAQRDNEAGAEPLQIVDEPVTAEDLLMLARDVGGRLTYLRTLSIFRTNDYAHALVERGAEETQPLEAALGLPLRVGHPGEDVLLRRVRKRISRLTRAWLFQRWWRAFKVRRAWARE